MKLYSGVVFAVRQVKGDYQTSYRVATVLSDSSENAISKLCQLCYENFPTVDGWYQHRYSVQEVLPWMVEAAYDETAKSGSAASN